MNPIPRLLPAVTLAAALVAATSCGNPFGSSETHGSRFTPTIDNLSVSRSTVFAGTNFGISFDYADPQGDIDTINLTLTGEDNSGFIQEIIPWPHRTDATCADCHPVEPALPPPHEGKMVITYAFKRDQNNPSGIYALRISLTDVKNHQSDTLQESITLL